MKQLWRIIRAILITVGFMAVLAALFTMLIWSKGLFALVMFFSVVLYVVYDVLGESK